MIILYSNLSSCNLCFRPSSASFSKKHQALDDPYFLLMEKASSISSLYSDKGYGTSSPKPSNGSLSPHEGSETNLLEDSLGSEHVSAHSVDFVHASMFSTCKHVPEHADTHGTPLTHCYMQTHTLLHAHTHIATCRHTHCYMHTRTLLHADSHIATCRLAHCYMQTHTLLHTDTWLPLVHPL